LIVDQQLLANVVKNFATKPEFRPFCQISSRRPLFVISSVYRKKRNPLEPTNEEISYEMDQTIKL